MNDPCGLEELDLLDYLLGAASPELSARIGQSTACRDAAARLAQQLTRLYRSRCPDTAALVAYQERRLADSTLQLVVHQHVGACPHCAEELALLAVIDAVPLAPAFHPLRRTIQAVLQTSLNRAVPVRGDLLLYQTPLLTLHVRVRQALAQPGAWTVRGQVRTVEGRLAGDLLQAVSASAADRLTIQATLNQGGFGFEHLPAGTWTLELQTPDEAIVISDFVVGESGTDR